MDVGEYESGASTQAAMGGGNKDFTTLERARLVAFDAHEYARNRLGWGL